MITSRLYHGLFVSLAILVAATSAARAEDFSIHIDRMADVDTNRRLPDYTIERMPTADPSVAKENLPRQTYDVHLRLKDYGDACLDQGYEERVPGADSSAKGSIMRGGLVDLDSVKAGWIKGSPGLLLVGWVSEHGPGNDPTPDHNVAILQLSNGKINELGRRTYPCGVRTVYFHQGMPIESGHFSWNTDTNRLNERIGIERVVTRTETGPLMRPVVLDKENTNGYIARLNETVNLQHAIVEGKLVPHTATMTVNLRNEADLDEVAGFYLFGDMRTGEPETKPFKDVHSARQALLDANPHIATRFKDAEPGAPMTLGENTQVRLPVDEKQLFARYAHTGTPAMPASLPAATPPVPSAVPSSPPLVPQ